MIASSSTVLANLAYLIGAVVLAVIAGLIVWLRHRQPRSVDANMASFRRGLSALAPDEPGGTRARRPESAVIRATPVSHHVRLEPAAGRADAGDEGFDHDLEEADDMEDSAG